MTNLPDFLLARIAEDEAVARDASGRAADWFVEERWAAGDWGAHEGDSVVLGGGKPLAVCDPQYGGGLVTEHIARHDPARVLAECDAKRRIVAKARAAAEVRQSRFADRGWMEPAEFSRDQALDEVLRLLAVPYADHPDYREEWKP